MIPDRLQYFLEHFWNDQKRDQILSPGPLIYYKNTSINIRRIMETFPKHIFLNLGTYNLGILKVCVPSFLKGWKLKNLQNRNMKFGNLEIEKGNWKSNI